MVMVLTTTSTWLFCSAAIRSADDRMRYSTWDGLPKMSRAISPAMSTSKPVISPVIGSRKENRLLPMSRPTISLPRLRIVETAASASALLVNGRRLAVRLQSPSSAGARAGSGGISSMPAGVGGARVTPGVGITAPPCAQPLSTTVAASEQRWRELLHRSIGRFRASAASSVLAQPRPQPQRHRHARRRR